MLPVLNVLVGEGDHNRRDVIERLAEENRLTATEREEMLPSGRARLFDNRIGWALTSLHHAGLIQTPRRGVWSATAEGRRALADSPTRIDARYLRQYPAFLAWVRGTASDGARTTRVTVTDSLSETPEETLERVWAAIRKRVASELLDAIRGTTPSFFERLVVELLVSMGYGGSYAEAAQVTRPTGDGGIDGLINEDSLGLDAIYVQAKRWDATIGRPEIQKFAGSLEGEHARKGVFLTTSTFSPEAKEYVRQIDKKIVLIDGARLADLMIEHGVGVTNDREYMIPKLDLDFFEE